MERLSLILATLLPPPRPRKADGLGSITRAFWLHVFAGKKYGLVANTMEANVTNHGIVFGVVCNEMIKL